MSDNDYKVDWVYSDKKDSRDFNIDKIKDTIYEVSPSPIKLFLDPKKSLRRGIRKAPIFKQVYEDGAYDGKKAGYEQASREYEDKLLKQAEYFLKNINDFSKARKDYEKLIDEYEKYIEEMSAKDSISNEDQAYLNKIMLMERKLKDKIESL